MRQLMGNRRTRAKHHQVPAAARYSVPEMAWPGPSVRFGGDIGVAETARCRRSIHPSRGSSQTHHPIGRRSLTNDLTKGSRGYRLPQEQIDAVTLEFNMPIGVHDIYAARVVAPGPRHANVDRYIDTRG